jgi:hypothetical protein
MGLNVIQQGSVRSQSRVPGIWKSNFPISKWGKQVVVADSNVPTPGSRVSMLPAG